MNCGPVLADARGDVGNSHGCCVRPIRPHFTRSEVRFVASLAEPLADGLRRAALFGEGDRRDDDGTGLMVSAPDNTVEWPNGAADRFLAELGTRATVDAHVLPTAVRRSRPGLGGRSSDGRDTGVARARVRTGRGAGCRARLAPRRCGRDGRRVAVMLEAARPPELAPLIADAYGFTERERRSPSSSRGLLDHRDRRSAPLLAVHGAGPLKSIFGEVRHQLGGDLVARPVLRHYAPRLSTPPVLGPDRRSD